MNSLADAGIYVSHFSAPVNRAAAYADVPWFLALTGWILVLALWWWRPRSATLEVWRWLPVAAGAGVLTALVHLAHMVFSRLPSSPNGPFLWGDLALGALAALASTAWWWVQGTRRTRILCGPLALLLLSAAALRYDYWAADYASWVLAIGCAACILPAYAQRDAGAWARLGALFAAALPFASTVGPIAYRFDMLARYTALNPAAFGSGVAHALAAAVALGGLAGVLWRPLSADQKRRFSAEARPFLLGGGVWALLCVAVALAVGGRQRMRTEEQALEQVRVAAALFPTTVLAPLADPGWQLDSIPPAKVRNNPIRSGWSKFLASGAVDPLGDVVSRVADSARTATYVRLVTQRSDWLFSPFNYHTPREGWFRRFTRSVGRGEGRVLLLRQPTAADQAAWRDQAEVVEGPIVTPIMANGHVFVRAPLRGPAQEMVGWLEFTFPADEFLSPVIHARVAPLTGLVLGEIVLVVFFLQRRHARARAEASQAAAAAAAANQLKTDFLARVSHELRTPLQSLLGYGELLARHLPDEAGRRHLVAQRQQGELMLRLVNDLLDLSALEAGAFRFVSQPVAPGDLVQQTVDSLRPRAEAKGLALSCEIAEGVPAWVKADPVRLRQVVFNLVGNAVKFTPRGSVVVSLASEASSQLVLTVRDTGPGIAPAAQASLFQPFARLERDGDVEGSGLGLALTAALCRHAGGSITVESDGVNGTVFRATLVAPACTAPAAAATDGAAAPDLAGRRVLVADDNALVRELFRAGLTELGAIVETAVDGTTALARASAGGLDAAVLDFAMPGLDGLEVARRLRAGPAPGSRLHLVGVSAHASPADREQALGAGMDAFLAKPVELDALAAAVARGPVATAVGIDERFKHLRRELAAQFRTQAEPQAGAVESALNRDDWPGLKRAAHHLKNSAGVVGALGLYEACTQVEDAADAADSPRAHAAWRQSRRQLDDWLASG